MKVFINGLLDKINSIKVQKSNDPTAGSNEAAPSTIEKLASDIVDKINSGEMEADVDSVKGYLSENGISSEEADEIAPTIVDAYFSGDESTDPDTANGSEVNKSANPSVPEPSGPSEETQKQILKSINDLTEAVGVLGLGLTHALSQLETAGKEQAVIKSDIEKYLSKPVTKSNVVEQVAPKANPAATAAGDAVQTKNLILKGVIDKQLSVEDMSAWEVRKTLTPAAEKYISEVSAK